MIGRALGMLVVCSVVGQTLAETPQSRLACDCDGRAEYRFGGFVGERIAANVDGWLVRAPVANPGLLAMFRLRDREPRPKLVPWAGEFVGKYLIAVVQALRMSNDEQLQRTAAAIVEEVLQ